MSDPSRAQLIQEADEHIDEARSAYARYHLGTMARHAAMASALLARADQIPQAIFTDLTLSQPQDQQ